MAKVPFSKLQVKIDSGVVNNFYHNTAGEKVYYEVKHYLPFKEKLELVSSIINNSIDENGFYNPMRVKLYMTLEVVYAYTNLSFTEKQKEDPFKLYDLLVSTGIFMDVLKEIAEHDWADIQDSIKTTIDNIYNYRNSVMGILEAVSADYSDLNLDADVLADKVLNPESLATLKELLPLAQ